MKKFIALTAILFLSACAASKEDILAVKPQEAIVLMNLRIRMDNNEETSFKNQCGILLKDVDGKEYIPHKNKDSSYYTAKTPAGKIYLSQIGCISNRVLFNKHRIAPLKDIYFVAQPGVVNYIGDFSIEWDSDRLNAGDFILGMGGLAADEGKIVIGLQTRPENARQYMKIEYPSLYLQMLNVPVSDNGAIIR
jgi:hypothetical protein